MDFQRWENRYYKSEVWTYVNSDDVAIKYTDGFPDFKSAGFVKTEVDVRSFDGYDSVNGVFKGYREDFKQANKIYDTSTPNSIYTWHHNQDTHTLQLVPRDIHSQFKHRGGLSVLAKGY